MSASVEY